VQAANDIVRFRGEHGSGVSDETGLPVRWDDNTNIVWKCEMPGFGSSSPIVLDNKIYLTCYSGYGLSEENPGNEANLERDLVCIDRESGKILWSKPIQTPGQPNEDYQGRKTLHGFATSTLTTD